MSVLTTTDEHIAPRLESSALLIIDVQQDFVDGGASPVPGTSEVVPSLVELVTAYRAAALPIVHVVRLYAGDDVDRVRRSQIAAGQAIVAPGSSGSLVVDALLDGAEPDPQRLLSGELVPVGPNEVVMWKPRWSAFHRTKLDDHLRGHDVTTTVVAGCNFCNCPRATIYDCSERDYRVLVPSDAVSGIEQHHLAELDKLGVVHAETAAVVSTLEQYAT